MKPDLKIEDLSAFFAGSIYPDSRYVTRVSRDTTHGLNTPQNPFIPGLSDFEKGWATHSLYDRLAGNRMREFLKGNPDTSREALITMTAMKLLEDQQSYGRLGSEAINIFRTIQASAVPNGEDGQAIRAYFEMNAELYAKRPDFDDYKRFFFKFLPSPEYGEIIIREAQRLSNQRELKETILAIYSQIPSEVRLLNFEIKENLRR